MIMTYFAFSDRLHPKIGRKNKKIIRFQIKTNLGIFLLLPAIKTIRMNILPENVTK